MMFEREAFERLVLSHIPAANRISPGRLWTIALRAGNPHAIAIVALLVLWIAIEMARLARHL